MKITKPVKISIDESRVIKQCIESSTKNRIETHRFFYLNLKVIINVYLWIFVRITTLFNFITIYVYVVSTERLLTKYIEAFIIFFRIIGTSKRNPNCFPVKTEQYHLFKKVNYTVYASSFTFHGYQ